jgi:hypothetical protein
MSANEKESDPEMLKKKSREKSVKYPYYSLKECVDYLSIIHEIGGKKEAPFESILSKLEVTSINNRRFTYLTSSAENFSLIEKTNVGIKPTENGTLILYPPSGEEQRKKLLIDAFKSPLLYQKILERYNNMILPNKEILKNIFYSLGIARIVLDTAVNSFIESAQYANVLDPNNRLTVPNSDNNEITTPVPSLESHKEGDAQKSPIQPPIKDAKEYSHNETEFLKLEILTTNRKKASISIPSDWMKEDIETLIKLLRVYSPE